MIEIQHYDTPGTWQNPRRQYEQNQQTSVVASSKYVSLQQGIISPIHG